MWPTAAQEAEKQTGERSLIERSWICTTATGYFTHIDVAGALPRRSLSHPLPLCRLRLAPVDVAGHHAADHAT